MGYKKRGGEEMRLIFVPLYDDVLLEKRWLLAAIVNGDEVDIDVPDEYREKDCWMEYTYTNEALTIHTNNEHIKLIEGNQYSTDELKKIKKLFDKAKKNLREVYNKTEKEKKKWEKQSPLIMEVKNNE